MNEEQRGISSISPGKSIYYMIKVTIAIDYCKDKKSRYYMSIRLQIVIANVNLIAFFWIVNMVKERKLI